MARVRSDEPVELHVPSSKRLTMQFASDATGHIETQNKDDPHAEFRRYDSLSLLEGCSGELKFIANLWAFLPGL